MQTGTTDKKLFVLHNNSGISSVIDDIMFCAETNCPHTEVGGMPPIFRPDLVLQAFQMMGDDCILICRDLRQEDKLKGAPVIMATAHRPEKSLANNIAFDAAERKPRDMRKMALTINNLLSVLVFTYLVMNTPDK